MMIDRKELYLWWMVAWMGGAVSYAGFHALLIPTPSCAADLRLPKQQSMRAAPLPHPARRIQATPIAPAIPSSNTPQLCLETGKEPFPGQTLQADASCPTGLRWKFQK